MSEHESTLPGPSTNDEVSYLAAGLTTWVALTFCLCVIGLLTVNAVIARTHDPLAAEAIDLLKADLATAVEKEPIRAQIRDLDAQLRAGYFAARQRAVQGAYLLGVGIAVFFLGAHLTAKFRARSPLPDPNAAGRSWIDAALSLRSLAALGLVMAGGLLALVILARHDASAEYIRTVAPPEQVAAGPAAAEAGAVPLPGGAAQAGPQTVAVAPPSPADVSGGAPPPPPPPVAVEPSGPAPAPSPAPTDGTPVVVATEQPTPQPTGPSQDAPTAAAAGDIPAGWPTFRGAAGLKLDVAKFPLDWDDASGKSVAWKTDIPLPGNNSPIFFDGRLFLSGADETRREVYGVDAKTGKLLWTTPFDFMPGAGPDPPKVMEDTGYAASTMGTDGQRVFSIYPDGNLAAHDLDGKLVWSKALGPLVNVYGHASSLAIYRDRLIVQLDQGSSAEDKLSALIAFEAATGKQAWRTERPVRNSWSSPLVIEAGGKLQVITSADPFVIAYDPATGAELWRTKCLSGDVGPSPTYADGLVYAANDMAGVFALRATGGLGGAAGSVVWSAKDGIPDTTSPAANGDIVVLVTSYGTVTCYDAKKGTKLWEEDLKSSFQSSPVIVGDRVYLSDIEGATFIFAAAREYKALGTGKVAEPVRATPAFVDGRIYLRSDTRLYCLAPE
jgi:outer membrane protein assembly factor BamB